MSILLSAIKSLDQGAFTKQEKIVRGVTSCIQDELLCYGDVLPSVNKLSSNLGFARETVVKAYGELKERGLVNSKQGLGYFIANHAADQQLNIGLVLYGFQTFQQDFYNKFRKCLGSQFNIDVFFHHNNIQMYESIINSIKHKYGMYVIAPIQTSEGRALIEGFPDDKLLLIDRYQYINENVASISQEFEQSLYRVCELLEDRIQDFDKILLYYKADSDNPAGIYDAINEYCRTHDIRLEVYEEYELSHMQKGTLFCTVGDTELWQILKDTKELNFKLGDEIGILSHNDSPVKEIISGGITTFSTDFKLMAAEAADFIINRKFTNRIIPSELIRRKSL